MSRLRRFWHDRSKREEYDSFILPEIVEVGYLMTVPTRRPTGKALRRLLALKETSSLNISGGLTLAELVLASMTLREGRTAVTPHVFEHR